MPQKSNKPVSFWEELNRRKVIQVITVYAAVAFILLQLFDIVSQPLQWPKWTLTFVIALLCIGFIIAVLLSWVYDITPSGVRKTKPLSTVKHSDHTSAPSSLGWKITTYAGALIIVGLIAFNYINRRNLNSDISKLEKSIAVLPFINDSPSDSTTYFINGLMEEILNNLQRIKAFSRVLSRTSTEKYRKTDKTIPEIAKELGVNFIVEGSGQKYGKKLVLRVQLIAGKKEKHLWGESYDREIKQAADIISVQSDIAQSIAAELKAAVIPDERKLIEKVPTSSISALSYFQRGRDEHTKYWLAGGRDKLKNAILYYKLALKIDSAFAQAYTGLAMARMESYWSNVYDRMTFSESELKILNDSVLSLADKALTYNNKLDEAYLVRGLCTVDNNLALKEFRKAVENNPSCSFAYYKIANILYYSKGDFIAGFKNLLRAVELERGPFLPYFLKTLGGWYEVYGFTENAVDIYKEKFQLTKDTLQYYQDMSGPFYAVENWEESIRWAKKILEKDPDHSWANNQLAGIYSYIGKLDSTVYYYKNIVAHDTSYWSKSIQGTMLWLNGNIKDAKLIFDKVEDFTDKLIKAGVNIDGNAYTLTSIYSIQGDQKRAMEYFNMISGSLRNECWFITEMENAPTLQCLRSNDEFLENLEKSKSNWQKEHDKIGAWLKEQGLLKE